MNCWKIPYGCYFRPLPSFFWVGLISCFVLSSYATDRWEPNKTHVIIVGVCNWEADLTRYSTRRRKDKELYELLIKRGTPTRNITMLLDSDATLSNIRKTIDDTLRRTSEESTLIVYFAGHGWKAGNDFHFANYDARLGARNAETVWSMNALASTVTEGFNGHKAIFLADCCYSGGMQVIVEKLAANNVASFSLTSAAMDNTSTGNWTFTQIILDSLAGSPIVDTNKDERITLSELRAEIKNAMTHLEGQSSGFFSNGIDDSFVVAETSGVTPQVPQSRFPIGSYVRVNGRYGRVVGVRGDNPRTYSVQFYNYNKKVVKNMSSQILLFRCGNHREESLG